MRRRSSWALPVLVALLVAVPILETLILIKVGHAIGTLPTILVLVAEAALGGWLMKREGARAWQALRATLGTGRLPAAELTDAALVLVGGVLLMLPGFLTDLVGFVFLLPFTRPLARQLVAFFAAREVARTGFDPRLLRARTIGGQAGGDQTIEGEVVDEPTRGATRAQRPGQRDGGEPPAISGTVL